MYLSPIFFFAALIAYGLDLVFFVARVRAGRSGRGSQRWILFAAFLLHTVALVMPAVESGQCPLFSVQDSLSFLAWIIVVACLLLGLRFRLSALEGFAPTLIIVLMLASTMVGHRLALPMNIQAKTWIALHAAFYSFGYAAFAVTFLSGLVYLILENQLKNRHVTVFTGDLGSLALMDKINHVALRVGVFCLTAGIAVGFGIVKEVHGTWFASLWKDPKIAVALFTWVLYMTLLFVRATNRLRGRKVAYLSMLGFALVLATFFSVHHAVKSF